MGERKSRIFFRKDNFNSPIEFGDREIIAKIEDEITYINGLRVLAREKEVSRKLKAYTENDNAQEVAKKLRELLYPQQNIKEDRGFLQLLIKRFAEKNIFVFEFVETWNKKEKSNFNGCFIAPNNIIIKRQQGSFKREIFTLAHELGHYLLDQEELDKIDFSEKEKSDIERWCDQFAFYFLVDVDNREFIEKEKIFQKSKSIGNLAFLQKYHISRLAFLTYLVADKKSITWQKYNELKSDLDREYRGIKDEKENEKKFNKVNGVSSKGMPALEIISPLKDHIYKSAFFEGVIGEFELIDKLKLKRRKKIFEEFLYE